MHRSASVRKTTDAQLTQQARWLQGGKCVSCSFSPIGERTDALTQPTCDTYAVGTDAGPTRLKIKLARAREVPPRGTGRPETSPRFIRMSPNWRIFYRAGKTQKAFSSIKMDRCPMAANPVVTPAKPKRRTGRPTRAEASAKALAGVNLAEVNPELILRAIAADVSMPGTARVQAARSLLALENAPPPVREKLGKKELRARAAATAGEGTDWNGLLRWPPEQ
jgi:hypothetical protein